MAQQCDAVILRAGTNYDGTPASFGEHGDMTLTCKKFGRPVPHVFKVKRLGTTNVYDPVPGTVIRCKEHADA